MKNDANKVVHVRISHQGGRFRVVQKDNFRTLADLLENYIRLPMVQVLTVKINISDLFPLKNGGSPVKLKTALPSTRFTAATIDDRIDCLLRASKKASSVKDGFVEEFEVLIFIVRKQLNLNVKKKKTPII